VYSWIHVFIGSVLGPVLFLLFVNDMPDNVDSDLYMFADDTKVSRTIRDAADVDKLQNDIDELYRWSEKWLLQFNASKCTKVSYDLGKKRNSERDTKYKLGEDFLYEDDNSLLLPPKHEP
jgi:hypothetical protein